MGEKKLFCFMLVTFFHLNENPKYFFMRFYLESGVLLTHISASISKPNC